MNYIELYKKMVPKLGIVELIRQKKSFENDIKSPGFSSSKEAIILDIIYKRLEEIS